MRTAKRAYIRHPRRWRLRTQLVVTQVALMAAVSLVIGVVSVFSLNQFLVNRLDQQLRDLGGRAQHSFETPPGGDLPPADPCTEGGTIQLPPGSGLGTLVVVACSGTQTVQGTISTDANIEGEPLTGAELVQLTAAAPADGRSYTVAVGDHGSYRVMARTVHGGNVLITGLSLSDVYGTLWLLTFVISVVTFSGLLAVAIAGAAIVRWALRPLGRVATTARRVARLPLDRGEVALAVRVPESDTDPGTEVGQVGTALNRMLEHVAAALGARQASEMRVRRFVADASHELRTPLASIRGYAELTRRSRAELAPDVAHALSRVESEAQRMTVLVEELLLLARLDEGRPLDREPVDLSRLVVDAVSDAHAAGRDHRWNLDLPEDPVTVLGDQVRLHQVVANLLANARTHTPPGTDVGVRLSVRDAVGVPPDAPPREVLLEVADNGPGVPPELLGEVFERFARADTSRSRTAGSSGLGLAIVQAVVQAHGGRVGVDSRPGRTVFAVLLPLAVDPAGQNGNGAAAGSSQGQAGAARTGVSSRL